MNSILEPESKHFWLNNAIMIVAEVADDSGNLKNFVFPGVDEENLEW